MKVINIYIYIYINVFIYMIMLIYILYVNVVIIGKVLPPKSLKRSWNGRANNNSYEQNSDLPNTFKNFCGIKVSLTNHITKNI